MKTVQFNLFLKRAAYPTGITIHSLQYLKIKQNNKSRFNDIYIKK